MMVRQKEARARAVRVRRAVMRRLWWMERAGVRIVAVVVMMATVVVTVVLGSGREAGRRRLRVWAPQGRQVVGAALLRNRTTLRRATRAIVLIHLPPSTCWKSWQT